MKEGIHPKYYPEAKVICACGNTWITGSTQEVVRTEMCSKCHPFFTGEQRIVDTAGQVERFRRRVEKAEKISEEKDLRRLEKQQRQETLFELVAEEEPREATTAEAQPAAEEKAAEEKPRAKRRTRKARVSKAKAQPASEREVAEEKPAPKRRSRKARTSKAADKAKDTVG